MRYIAIEGCIASGKTTLARALAEKFSIQPTLEDYHNVPSLELFYKDPIRYAFKTEIQFTQYHFNLLASARPTEDSFFVVDFTLKRDLLFANITLECQPDKLKEYKQFWQELARQLPEPDLILLLEAPVDELLRRIKARGRSFEQRISADYLERIVTGLNETYQDAPDYTVLKLDSSNISELLASILGYLERFNS